MVVTAKHMHHHRHHNHISPILNPKLLLLFALWLLPVLFFLSQNNGKPLSSSQCSSPSIASPCIYDLSQNFNLILLRRCGTLNIYTDMCPHVANHGLGRPLNDMWCATHQFIAEMIYPLRTLDPDSAEMFYVPFYQGLYASSQFREPDFGVGDGLGVELVEFVVGQPKWRRMNGRDHFLVIGRTAWDFMRADNVAAGGDFGADRLLLLPW